jgi:subtilase family serine protease
MLRSFSFRLALSALLLPSLVAASAQTALPKRIVGAVSNASRTTIANSVHGQAKAAADLGATDPGMKLQGMTIHFNMTDAQSTALDVLLANQQNPASAQYHQWLTPAQYGAQFGVSSADIATISAWLSSQGFTVNGVPAGSNAISFNGTVGQAEAAFGTSIHNLSYNGETHFANVSDISVPSAFGSLVTGVTGLHNFRLKSKARTSVVKAPVKSAFTSSISGSHYVAPGDFYNIYDETPLLNNSINGTGVTIAVVGQTDVLATDIAAFRAASGLSVNAPTLDLVPAATYGGCDPGIYTSITAAQKACDDGYPPTSDDLAESSLDLEWAGAVAPGATVAFIYSQDVLGISLYYAIEANVAPIISLTYGLCEQGWGSTEINLLNGYFKQANAQGQTISVAAGDGGAADCDAGTTAIEGLAVDFPGSSPYVTDLGGTEFTDTTGTYWLSADATLAAGTAVPGATYSATGYIPEMVWNDNTSGATFSAGGGGVSAYFTKPAWQVGTPADSSRDVPDLSLNASDAHDPYLYCAAGSCVTGFRASDGQTLTVAGGTSFAAPNFAGILALIEQKTGSKIGNANPTIYALANSSTYKTSVFHDTTVGNNDDPCTSGTTGCPTGVTQVGYSATAGYDVASGWGSVDASQLVNAWTGVTPLGAGTLGANISTTNLSATPTSAVATVAGTNVSVLTASVTGTAATPTGTVQFLIDNVAVGSPVTLSSGVATYNLGVTCSLLGAHSASASYSGDGNYQGSKGPALYGASAGATGGASYSSNGTVGTTPLTITGSAGSCPDFSVTPASTTLSAATISSSSTLVVTAASVNAFTGTVTFSATTTSNGSGYAPTFTFTPASVTLTSGGTATTTLNISVPIAELQTPHLFPNSGSGIELAKNGGRIPWYAAGSGVTIASLLLIVLPRRRRLGALLVLLLSVAVVGGAGGCGASNTVSAPAVTATAAGTYAITIVGTYTSTSGSVNAHSTTVTYTVP